MYSTTTIIPKKRINFIDALRGLQSEVTPSPLERGQGVCEFIFVFKNVFI